MFPAMSEMRDGECEFHGKLNCALAQFVALGLAVCALRVNGVVSWLFPVFLVVGCRLKFAKFAQYVNLYAHGRNDES